MTLNENQQPQKSIDVDRVVYPDVPYSDYDPYQLHGTPIPEPAPTPEPVRDRTNPPYDPHERNP
jgi:hypothetical protein